MSEIIEFRPKGKKRPSWSWADRVRKVRRDMGLTQAEFAAVTGFGAKAVAAWESGKNTPNLTEVSVKLENATGVDRLWWLGWDQESPPTPGPGASVSSG